MSGKNGNARPVMTVPHASSWHTCPPGKMGFPTSSSAKMLPTLHMSTSGPYRSAPSSSSGGLGCRCQCGVQILTCCAQTWTKAPSLETVLTAGPHQLSSMLLDGKAMTQAQPSWHDPYSLKTTKAPADLAPILCCGNHANTKDEGYQSK
eukprot:1159287-Pelagomonas_calceolata.AAC.4